MAFLDEKFETMPADEIKAMQLKLLKELVKNTYSPSTGISSPNPGTKIPYPVSGTPSTPD